MGSDPPHTPRRGNGDHEVDAVGVLECESRLKPGETGKRIAKQADSTHGVLVIDRGKVSGVAISFESKPSDPPVQALGLVDVQSEGIDVGENVSKVPPLIRCDREISKMVAQQVAGIKGDSLRSAV